MYRKDVNERSPMRVFENSIHGGLGRGNLGIIAAGPGVGKTPLLVQIALDDLLRDRRVLHISHDHAVDHVRTYYSEIFHDLATAAQLESSDAVKLDVERHRLIFSLMSDADSGPITQRGGSSPVSKILEVVAFARNIAHFSPDVIVIDGFDLVHGTDEALKALGDLARELKVELWLSVNLDAEVGPSNGLPEPLKRFSALFNVAVVLEPERDVVRIRLLKDHESTALADLHLRLDPHTLRVIDEDVRAVSERPLDARRFRLVSGGSRGAEAAFGVCAERWGLTEVNYAYAEHRYLERSRGVVTLSESELKKGDFSLVYASKRLNRTLTKIPFVRNVLQTIWHQITNASEVFAVGVIQEDGTVRGGTGWGVELARLWKKPLFVFDQAKKSWFRWSGKAWEISSPPVVTRDTFAGIGTQSLTEDGQVAIKELFQRSFGDPA